MSIVSEEARAMAGKRLTLDEIITMVDNATTIEDLRGISPAETIDAAFELREIIREEQRKIKAKSDILNTLEDLILNHLDAAGTEDTPLMSMGGLNAVATRTEEDVATVTDWDAFYEYCEENHASYMFQRRINNSSVLEAHKMSEIPGISITSLTKLRLRKL